MELRTDQERLEYLELVLGNMAWFVQVELLLEYHELKVKKMGRWTITDTSHILGRSFPSVNKDLYLARAIKKFPQLKNCKTKDEAERVSKTYKVPALIVESGNNAS